MGNKGNKRKEIGIDPSSVYMFIFLINIIDLLYRS